MTEFTHFTPADPLFEDFSSLPMAEDRLARYTFHDPVKAAGLLLHFLDPKILACLDLDALVRIEDQQIEDSLKERRDGFAPALTLVLHTGYGNYSRLFTY